MCNEFMQKADHVLNFIMEHEDFEDTCLHEKISLLGCVMSNLIGMLEEDDALKMRLYVIERVSKCQVI